MRNMRANLRDDQHTPVLEAALLEWSTPELLRCASIPSSSPPALSSCAGSVPTGIRSPDVGSAAPDAGSSSGHAEATTAISRSAGAESTVAGSRPVDVSAGVPVGSPSTGVAGSPHTPAAASSGSAESRPPAASPSRGASPLFDVVIASDVFYCVEAAGWFFISAAHLLRPGGLLVLSHRSRWHVVDRALQHSCDEARFRLLSVAQLRLLDIAFPPLPEEHHLWVLRKGDASSACTPLHLPYTYTQAATSAP
jgi:hypothetical protein